jgi:lysophospholipid acyltransferase 1/2/lysophospholipid acyltransferase
MIGFDVETLNYTLGLFLCYPLGMLMNYIPYGKTRHLTSFLLGAFLLQFTLGVQWIHQLITSLLVYGMLLVLPQRLPSSSLPLSCCTASWATCRQYVNYLGWDLDFTGTQMVLKKLHMIAFNLYGCCLKNKRTRVPPKVRRLFSQLPVCSILGLHLLLLHRLVRSGQ